ncbi:hypothetical protein BSKO_13776 [Bryopsis sp. KO-2023]|nr:hypothetical protein BSKO_13776 [Bryopsis sp. KO-2023]
MLRGGLSRFRSIANGSTALQSLGPCFHQLNQVAGVRSKAEPVSKKNADYIEPGLPELDARNRCESGKKIAAKLRKDGRIPAILFALPGNTSKLIHVDRVQLMKKLKEHGLHGFLARPLKLTIKMKKAGDESYRVLPRLVHERNYSAEDYIENVTFMFAPRNRTLRVPVPIKVIGRDVAPGCKRGGFPLMIRRVLELKCPADKIPPFVELDVSGMDIKDKIFPEQMVLPPGTEYFKQLARNPICKMATAKGA